MAGLNLILSGALMWASELSGHAGQSVTLSWNPSEVTNVAGYKIYYGTTSLNYSSVITVGNTNTATITGLMAGATYYFAATTLDAAGNESGLSNEASFTLPSSNATLTDVTRTAGQFSFTVGGMAGRAYVVQASTDLLNWVALQTNAAPFIFVDSTANNFGQRFYRTREQSP